MNGGATWRAVVRVGAVGGAGKVLLVARDLVIAHRLGLGDGVEAFMVASMVVLFVTGVLSTAIGNAFLPLFVKTRQQRGEAAAHDLLARTTGLALLVGGAVGMLTAAAAHPLFAGLAPGFPAAKRELTVALFLVMTPGTVLSIGSLTFVPALCAEGRLLTASLGPVINAAVSFLVIVLAGAQAPVTVLAWAALAGSAAEACWLAWACRRQRMPILPRWKRGEPELGQIVRQSLPLAAAALLSMANGLIDQLMASGLGTGAVASLGYGRKLVQLVVPLATMALSTVYFPRLAQLSAAGEWGALRATVRACLRTVMSIAIPATVILVMASHVLVRLLFQRGAFTGADAEAVTAVQRMLLLQIPFHVGGIVSVRLLTVLGRNHLITFTTLVNLVVNVGGNWILMKPYGAPGIALATSLVFLVSFAQVQWFARRELNRQIGQVNRE